MNPSVEAFDEVKYKALMDGLECSELLFSNLDFGIRIDSELYQKKYLVLESFAKTHQCTTFFSESDVVKKGVFDISASLYRDTGVPFVRISNLKNMLISEGNLVYIPEEESSKNSATELTFGDIILSETVAPAASFVNLDLCNASQDTIAIKLKKNASVKAEFIVIFLNTVYGLAQLEKRFTGNIQMHLNLNDCKNKVIIPVFSERFQNRLVTLFRECINLNKKSVTKTYEASSIIENQLDPLSINNPFHAVRSLSESLLRTGRIDAEYYQPKYDKYKRLIENYKDGYAYIHEMFDQVVQNTDRSQKEYPYIEIGDIDVSLGEASINIIKTESLPANAKIMAKSGDILVSTVRPNRGAVAILGADNLLVSGAFTVLRQRGNYKREVLQTLLRTKLYRDWLLQYNVGTSYPVIKDEDVLNMPIPIFNQAIQDNIAASVQQSFAFRRKAKEMLEYAKHAVELAIEEDESTALVWLNKKLSEQEC